MQHFSSSRRFSGRLGFYILERRSIWIWILLAYTLFSLLEPFAEGQTLQTLCRILSCWLGVWLPSGVALLGGEHTYKALLFFMVGSPNDLRVGTGMAGRVGGGGGSVYVVRRLFGGVRHEGWGEKGHPDTTMPLGDAFWPE